MGYKVIPKILCFLEQMQQSWSSNKVGSLETPETLCGLVSNLSNDVADRWNRKALMLQRSQQRGP